jgi:hypothetical protein
MYALVLPIDEDPFPSAAVALSNASVTLPHSEAGVRTVFRGLEPAR